MTCPECGHESGRRTRYCPHCAKRLGPVHAPGRALRSDPDPVFVLEPASGRGGTFLDAAPYLGFLVAWSTLVFGGLSYFLTVASNAHPDPARWFSLAALLSAVILLSGWSILEGRRLASTTYTFRPSQLDVARGPARGTRRSVLPLRDIETVHLETTGAQARLGLGTLRLELRSPHPGQSPLIAIEDIPDPELWRTRIVELLGTTPRKKEPMRRVA